MSVLIDNDLAFFWFARSHYCAWALVSRYKVETIPACPGPDCRGLCGCKSSCKEVEQRETTCTGQFTSEAGMASIKGRLDPNTEKNQAQTV
jgi:hypothetical protein